MAAFASPSKDNHSRRPSLSEKRWKEAFHSKLMEDLKKPKASNSLFWDWNKDVYKSQPSSRKSR